MSDLSPYEISEIEKKLPPQFAVLKDKYPNTIASVAESWDEPPYPEGYTPDVIEIYYEDDGQSGFDIKNGEITLIRIEDVPVSPHLIHLFIDDETAYVQIEGKVILNRIGGAILPETIMSNPELLLKSILRVKPKH